MAGLATEHGEEKAVMIDATYLKAHRTGQSAIDQRAINGLYRSILNVFSPVATNTAEGNFGFVDPMLQVQRQGTILAGAGGAALTVGVGLARRTAATELDGRAILAIMETAHPIEMAALNDAEKCLLNQLKAKRDGMLF